MQPPQGPQNPDPNAPPGSAASDPQPPAGNSSESAIFLKPEDLASASASAAEPPAGEPEPSASRVVLRPEFGAPAEPVSPAPVAAPAVSAPPQPAAAAPPPARPAYGAPPPAWAQRQRAPYGQSAPPPGWGGPPPGYAPPPGYQPPGPGGPPRRSKAPLVIGAMLLIGLFVVGGLVLATGALSGLASTGGGSSSSAAAFLPFGSKVAVLDVTGVLGEGVGYQADTAALIQQVRLWQDNQNVKALVLRINSPGGAVSATQELYEAILEFKQVRQVPVIASMGDVAASGGYYTAIASDEIFANPGTLTGSIGVILSFSDMQGLQDKVGWRTRAVKSGEFKDMGSGSRAMTQGERELLEDMIADVYEQFFDAVLASRDEAVQQILREDSPAALVSPMDVEAHVRALCDGRIFSGQQAYRSGMVDRLGTLQDAVNHAASLANLPADPVVVRGPMRPRGLFGAIESRLETLDAALPGGFRVEYRMALQ
ncbi:MAG: signal peptide peptidase SppA [Candidatus Sumerlaeia bacterium]|nr:signal peptide peptidase SppA [Candidatus Sumerlaeia bacterium]